MLQVIKLSWHYPILTTGRVIVYTKLPKEGLMSNRGIMGRYQTDSERKLVQYHMKLYDDQRTALDGLAKQLNVPMSEIIRTAVDAAIVVADNSGDTIDNSNLFTGFAELLTSVSELSSKVNKIVELEKTVTELQDANTKLTEQLDFALDKLRNKDEKAYRTAMVAKHGSIAAAASAIGVSRQTMYNSLQKT